MSAARTGDKALKRPAKKAAMKKDTQDAQQSLAAALAEPITKLDAITCFLGMTGILFGDAATVQSVAKTVGQRLGVPEPALLAGALDLVGKKRGNPEVAPTRGGKGPVAHEKKRAKGPTGLYKIFMSYALAELYKYKHLPIIGTALAMHGDNGRVSMATAQRLWSSVSAEDKERAGAVLKPFMDEINGERGVSASTAAHEEPLQAVALCSRYQQHLALHPEACLVRLLRLDRDGDTGAIGANQPVAAAGAKKPAAPPAATAVATAGLATLDASTGNSEDSEEDEGESASEETQGGQAGGGEEDEAASTDGEYASASSDSDSDSDGPESDGGTGEGDGEEQGGSGGGDDDSISDDSIGGDEMREVSSSSDGEAAPEDDGGDTADGDVGDDSGTNSSDDSGSSSGGDSDDSDADSGDSIGEAGVLPAATPARVLGVKRPTAAAAPVAKKSKR